MSSSFLPKQQNWHIYQDDAAEPTTQLSNENVLAPAVNNVSIVRVRVTIAETGGKAGSGAVTMEYSTDNTNFTAFGTGNHWNYADGQAVNGNSVTTNKCTDTTNKMHYHEDASGSESWTASTAYEMDFAIKPNSTAFGNTTYYFRFKIAGTEVVLNTSKTHPQIATAKFFKYGGAVASACTASLAEVGRKLKFSGALAAVSSLAAAVKFYTALVLKVDQWIVFFPQVVFGGAVGSSSGLSENMRLLNKFYGSMASVSSLVGQSSLFSRFSGAAASVSALSGQGILRNRFAGAAAAVSSWAGQSTFLNRFSGVIASVSSFSLSNLISRLVIGGTTAAISALEAAVTFITGAATVVFGGAAAAVSSWAGQSTFLNRFSGVIASVSSFSLSNLISRLVIGGTTAAISALEVALTFVGGAATVVFGGAIAAVSALSAVVRLIGLVILKVDQWITEFVGYIVFGGAFSVSSSFSLPQFISRLVIGGAMAVISALEAALTFVGTVVLGGAIAAVSSIVARVALIVQIQIDLWQAKFDIISFSGSIAADSVVSSLTAVKRFLKSAGSVAVISSITGSIRTVGALLFFLGGAVVSTVAISFDNVIRRLSMAAAVVSVSSLSLAKVQSLLRLAGLLAATSSLSFAKMILRLMIAASLSAISSVTGSIRTIGSFVVFLSGAVAVVASLTFSSLISRLRMAATLAATSVLSAATTLRQVIAGIIYSVTSFSIAKFISRLRLLGGFAAVSTLVVATTLRNRFAGAVTAVSSLAGSFSTIAGIILGGMIAAVSSLSGTILSIFNLLYVMGDFVATSALSGATLLRQRLQGALAAVSIMAGIPNLIRLISGTVNAISSLGYGALLRFFRPSGQIRAISSFVAIAIKGAAAVLGLARRFIRPISLLMGRIRGDKRNKFEE